MGEKTTVAIAGATGFVGQALRHALVTEGFQVIGLTRSPTRAGLADEDGVQWRHCDLFSIGDVAKALYGADVALYLVHSMLPSARLDQANFADLDLLLADNFARGAQTCLLKQIVYVGGIQPEDDYLSAHLASRLEVEETLAGRQVPVTALRAGIILGPGGSSMRMMVNLVRKLPAMILPSWTTSVSAPIAIEDIVRAALYCIDNPETFGQNYELGGPDLMSYREMMQRTARLLGRRVPMLNIPLFTPGLSRRWVTMVTGAPDALVGPLIESLRHNIPPQDNPLQQRLVKDAVPFDEALKRSLDDDGKPVANPRKVLRTGDDARLRAARTVRSVQRLPLPEGANAEWVVHEYMRWLPRFVWPFLKVETINSKIRFLVRFTKVALLELTLATTHSTPDRQLFFISGGLLARVDKTLQGRFEFREVLDQKWIIAAIHDFRPMLPWYIYNFSQAIAHLIVMRGFGRHLGSIRMHSSNNTLNEQPSLPPG